VKAPGPLVAALSPGALIALVSLASLSSCSHPAAATDVRARPLASGAPTASSEPPPAVVVPVPETLALVAGQFGLTMQAEGFTWKVLRRNVTRFDWSGRPSNGKNDRELLYSFYIEKLDDTSARLLPELASSAAANLTEGEPCKPFDQPAEIVRKLGVDRIVTVCFEPSTFYGREHHHGVLHAVVHDRALTVVVVLSDESTAIIPLPKILGTQGKR
jgi:hypothetical protein